METWKRRGEPEKKIVTETRKENISAKRKPDRSVRRDWQVKDADGALQGEGYCKNIISL